MDKLHKFQDSLAWGDSKNDEPFWEATYNNFFPGMVNHMPTTGDYESQRMGIDRVIALNNGRMLRIDEKKRDKDYGDIALETHHTKEKDIHSEKVAEGWIKKNLFIDYLAYAIIPTQTVYLFDWLMLKRAWALNYVAWYNKAATKTRNGYFIASAKNPTYWSHSVCVPIVDLQDAITSVSVVTINTLDKAA